MAYSFVGGQKLRKNRSMLPWSKKHAKFIKFEKISPPSHVTISMEQHWREICSPTVKVGDTVSVGQVIGRATDTIISPVHSSVSGKVTEITQMQGLSGKQVEHIIIQNNRKHTTFNGLTPHTSSITNTTADEIVAILRRNAVTDFWPSPQSLANKIETAIGNVDRLVVKLFDSDSNTAVNYRLALENPQAVIGGIKLLLKALSLRRAIIVTEIKSRTLLRSLSTIEYPKEMLFFIEIKPKYPHYDNRVLISALTKKENVTIGSMFSKSIVIDAQTAVAVYQAFSIGMPHVERFITVSGDACSMPKNLSLPIGTSTKHVLSYCSYNNSTSTLFTSNRINGRPITENTIIDSSINSILIQKEHIASNFVASCTNCAHCVTNCPARISPKAVARHVKSDKILRARKAGLDSCVTCGLCSKVCPSGLPLFSNIIQAKQAMAKTPKDIDDASDKN